MRRTLITNPRNRRLREARRLHRRRERDRTQRFLAEGEDLIEAAARSGRLPLEGFRLAGSGLGGREFADVSEDALATGCALSSGSKAIAVFEQRWAERPVGPLCLYLHGLSDPGNVGAAIRSAAAFGASCVALSPRCADPHSPKAVRASMGAIFAVHLARCSTPAELPGIRIALAPRGGVRLSELRGRLAGAAAPLCGGGPAGRRSPLSILVGAERDGLPPEIVRGCDEIARIPVEIDSLNAAMAATIALYELTREDIEGMGVIVEGARSSPAGRCLTGERIGGATGELIGGPTGELIGGADGLCGRSDESCERERADRC